MRRPAGIARFLSQRPRLFEYMRGFLWTGLAQFFSAVSNFVISLAVARGGGAEALGLFTIAFSVYLLILSLQRALIHEPLLTIKPDQGLGEFRLALSSAIAYLVPAALIVSLAGWVLGRSEIVILGVVLPFVCLQDSYRYGVFWKRQPRLAALIDGSWVVVSLAAWPWLTSSGSAASGLIAWGLGGLAGLLIGASFYRVLPRRPSDGLKWWLREARSLGGYLAIDRMGSSVFLQINRLALAAILGAGDLGILRAAQMVLGPAGLAMTAFEVFALSRLSGVAKNTPRRAASAISGLAGLSMVVVNGTLLLLSPVLVPLMYGPALDVPLIILLGVGARMIVHAFSTGPLLLLKATRAGGFIVVARLATGPVGTAAIVIGAAAWGLAGAVWAGLVPATVHVVVLWVTWRRQTDSQTQAKQKSSEFVSR
ncbi:MAG: hypothetical protein ACRDVM_00900 [Acidimicrobiia bacterium]